MKNFKRIFAMGAAVVMLCTASITAMAADDVTPPANNESFICQVTGEICTLDHEHGTGGCLRAQDGTGAGICCTLDHDHTDDCILPGSGAGAGICCTLDHDHTDDCILPGSGTGCGRGRRDGTGAGTGGGHHGRGRHHG